MSWYKKAVVVFSAAQALPVMRSRSYDIDSGVSYCRKSTKLLVIFEKAPM